MSMRNNSGLWPSFVPSFCKWTIWGFSLEIYNHWAICRHQYLASWFPLLHIPGCERTFFFIENTRTLILLLQLFWLIKMVILAREEISFPFVLWSRSKLFYSFPVLLVLLVWLQSLNGTRAHTIPAHTKNAYLSRN